MEEPEYPLQFSGCDITPPDLISRVRIHTSTKSYGLVCPGTWLHSGTTCPEGSPDISYSWTLEADTMSAQGNSTSNSKSAHSRSPKIPDGSWKAKLHKLYLQKNLFLCSGIFLSTVENSSRTTWAYCFPAIAFHPMIKVLWPAKRFLIECISTAPFKRSAVKCFSTIYLLITIILTKSMTCLFHLQHSFCFSCLGHSGRRGHIPT